MKKPKAELNAIAQRCTPEVNVLLRKIQDRDLLALIIEALEMTRGPITEATIFVTLIQLKDELKKKAG
ncbi:MAG TPA: hypothetical protein VFO91_12600 [Anaerolineales bacterium]|nr:hypothetical protein [Anaerolineales bacterium]